MVPSLHPVTLEKYCLFLHSSSQALRVGVSFPKEELGAVTRTRESDADGDHGVPWILQQNQVFLTFRTFVHLTIVSPNLCPLYDGKRKATHLNTY